MKITLCMLRMPMFPFCFPPFTLTSQWSVRCLWSLEEHVINRLTKHQQMLSKVIWVEVTKKAKEANFFFPWFRFRFGRILFLCTLYREGRKDSNHSLFADVTVLWLFRCTQPSSPLYYVSCNVTIAYKLYNRKERKIMPILKTVCLKVHLKQFNASPLQENLT